jgi:hypothetical protein
VIMEQAQLRAREPVRVIWDDLWCQCSKQDFYPMISGSAALDDTDEHNDDDTAKHLDDQDHKTL